jgi:class 3 adenylate cyclase
MPLYMDIHTLPDGTTPEDIAKAHANDMATQQKYGVEYTKYWLNEKAGKVFCLCHAPNAEAAECVHREAHGMMAEKLIEIQPELADSFLGGVETNSAGAAVLPDAGADARDPGIRTVLFTDVVNSTTLTQALGDEAALAILGVHDVIVRDALSALGGREVKHTGDGIMASFVSAAGHHGLIRVGSGRCAMRNSDSARIGEACASKPGPPAQDPSRRRSRRTCRTA